MIIGVLYRRSSDDDRDFAPVNIGNDTVQILENMLLQNTTVDSVHLVTSRLVPVQFIPCDEGGRIKVLGKLPPAILTPTQCLWVEIYDPSQRGKCCGLVSEECLAECFENEAGDR